MQAEACVLKVHCELIRVRAENNVCCGLRQCCRCERVSQLSQALFALACRSELSSALVTASHPANGAAKLCRSKRSAYRQELSQ